MKTDKDHRQRQHKEQIVDDQQQPDAKIGTVLLEHVHQHRHIALARTNAFQHRHPCACHQPAQNRSTCTQTTAHETVDTRFERFRDLQRHIIRPLRLAETERIAEREQRQRDHAEPQHGLHHPFHRRETRCLTEHIEEPQSEPHVDQKRGGDERDPHQQPRTRCRTRHRQNAHKKDQRRDRAWIETV